MERSIGGVTAFDERRPSRPSIKLHLLFSSAIVVVNPIIMTISESGSTPAVLHYFRSGPLD